MKIHLFYNLFNNPSKHNLGKVKGEQEINIHTFGLSGLSPYFFLNYEDGFQDEASVILHEEP
jgi:hypothetical protein